MTSTNYTSVVADDSQRTSGIASLARLKANAKKPIFSKWKGGALLSMFFLMVFATDRLLFKSVMNVHFGWSGLEVWSRIGSSNVSYLDGVLCIVFTLLICIQLACRSKRKTEDYDAPKTPSSHKTLKTTNARLSESPDRSATGQRASNARWNQDIDYATRNGDVDKASRLLLEFESQAKCQSNNQPDSVSYNLVIRACAKRGDYKGAEQWLDRMESRGVPATVCSYNTILDACAKADNADACESWLARMLDRGIQANVISYATVIYARARRGDEALAEKWLDSMLVAGIAPDAVSYNSMIHACGVNGNAAGAEKWIEAMKDRGLAPTVTTYTAVIDACAKAGDVPRAEKWLESMITAGVQPNVVSFSAMIDSCAKSCNPTRAEYWHDRMVGLGIKPNAHSFSAVINACAKAGDVIMAEKWLSLSEEAGVASDVVVYSSVIDACGKVGDAELAMKIFQRMQMNGIKPHIVAYAALARPFAYRGDFAAVETIAADMARVRVTPNEYFIYAQLLSYATARPRQPQRAEQCFRQAVHSGIKANDHIIGALTRAVGRQTCENLMKELCGGARSVPQPRREGGAYKSKPQR